jgi:hypothetical protein
MIAMSKVHPSPARRQLVYLAVQHGRTRVTQLLAPTLRVVREPDQAPRVEFVVPPMPEAA